MSTIHRSNLHRVLIQYSRFQYAAVHLENILQLPTARDIEDALERPAKDIMEVYRQTLTIIKSDPNWGPYVMRAFAWIRENGGSSDTNHLVVLRPLHNLILVIFL